MCSVVVFSASGCFLRAFVDYKGFICKCILSERNIKVKYFYSLRKPLGVWGSVNFERRRDLGARCRVGTLLSGIHIIFAIYIT